MRNSKGSSRRGRIAAWVVVAALAVTAFASLGGVGLAQSAIGLHQYQYGKKVTICHKGKKSVSISLRAWLAHKRHGDVAGTCFAWKKAHGKHWKKAYGKHWKKKQGKAWQKQHQKRWKKADRQRKSGDTGVSSDAKSSQQGVTFKVVSPGSGRDGKGAELGGNGHGKGMSKGNGHGKGGGKG